MKSIILILVVAAAASGQKAHKSSYAGNPKVSYSSFQDAPSHSQYGGAYQSQSSGAYQAQSPAYHHGAAATAAKPSYPVLLSDNRQLNHDGTINFNYAADNGLQQGETVDPDGTRRGFYSYLGADGKPLTVKYTAGKNGFIAEGAHLPMQPNVAAAASHSKDDGSGKGHDDGSYYSGGEAPSHYSSGSPRSPPSYSPASYTPSYHAGSPSYDPPSPYHNPQASRASYPSAGPSHSHYQSAPQTQYSHALPSHASRGNHGSYSGSGPAYAGSMHSATNPYTPAGAGPYAGQFDLGNGGTFSINFEPGAAQQVGHGGGPGAQY